MISRKLSNLFRILCTCFLIVQGFTSQAQEHFIDKCEGVWEGSLEMYNAKSQEASSEKPKVTFTVQTIIEDSLWTWRTDYESERFGHITKDYKLVAKDVKKGMYLLDEGDNLILDQRVIGTKMYSVFEVENMVLSASYELIGEHLIFEVLSSPRSKDTTAVISHTLGNMQRVTLSRKKN